MRATRRVGAGVDPLHLDRPHPAAIEGTLPRRVPTQRGDDAWLGVFINALEVRDDLDLMSKEIHEEGGFGTGAGVPGSATGARREAGIALASVGMADQIWRVSLRYGNVGGGGWRRDLRRRIGDCERACECESSHGQAPDSSRRFCLLIAVVAHLLVLHFSVLIRLRFKTHEQPSSYSPQYCMRIKSALQVDNL